MLPPVPRLPALAALGRRETEAWQWQGPGQGHTPVVGEIGFLPSFRGMLGSSEGQDPQLSGSKAEPGWTPCVAQRRPGRTYQGQRSDKEPGMLAEEEASLWSLSAGSFPGFDWST